ncbi:MAG: hypothetical protein PHI00_05435, partial [Atribacterota bacterium]|nr:hypothetical protein [Atribacterota bacterium]
RSRKRREEGNPSGKRVRVKLTMKGDSLLIAPFCTAVRGEAPEYNTDKWSTEYKDVAMDFAVNYNNRYCSLLI